MLACACVTLAPLTTPCRIDSARLNQGIDRRISCQNHQRIPPLKGPPTLPNSEADAALPPVPKQGTLLRLKHFFRNSSVWSAVWPANASPILAPSPSRGSPQPAIDHLEVHRHSSPYRPTARSPDSACACAAATKRRITLATLRSSRSACRSTNSRSSAGNGTLTCSVFIARPPNSWISMPGRENLTTPDIAMRRAEQKESRHSWRLAKLREGSMKREDDGPNSLDQFLTAPTTHRLGQARPPGNEEHFQQALPRGAVRCYSASTTGRRSPRDPRDRGLTASAQAAGFFLTWNAVKKPPRNDDTRRVTGGSSQFV